MYLRDPVIKEKMGRSMKRNLIIAILLLIFFQMAGCVSIYRFVRDKRDRNYNEGVELYRQNKFAAAHDRFETVVDIEPDYKNAQSYLRKSKRLLALKVQQIKREASIGYERGVYMMNKGRYDDALSILLHAQQQDPNHVDVDEKIDECRVKLEPKFENLVKHAELQFQRKQYIAAYQTCMKANAYNPSSDRLSSTKRMIEGKLEENAEKYVDKGTQYYEKKQYAAARNQLQLALRNNPWDVNSKELLGKINGKLSLDQNYRRGIYLFNKADYFGAKAAFGQVNTVENGYKATDSYMTKINNNLAGRIGIYYNNGVAHYDKGNYRTAIDEFSKVLAINPSHGNAQEYRQRAQQKLETQTSVTGR